VASRSVQGVEDAKTHYHSHALSRGLEIVRAVANTASPSTLTDLHESTGYPKSTLVRLLSVLEEEDYLIKVDERPSYRLGHAVLPIVMGYLQTASVADLLRPQLFALADLTGWTANFGIMEGTDVVHLCVEFPNRPIHYTAQEGTSSAAYCTGLGKAIMSSLDDAALARALPAEPFPKLTEHTITSRAAMLEELSRIRQRGYSIDAQEADLGLHCFAVVVPTGGIPAAISVSGPAGEVDPEREAAFVAALNDARDRLVAMPELTGALGLAVRRTGESI
jgi:IclR family transcriptional regulator, acetate operon repressor